MPDVEPDLRTTAALLKALADEKRLRIVALLAQGEVCVCHLADALQMSQPNVSQHLTVLKHAGIVEGERRGSWIHYRIPATLEPAAARIVASVLAAPLGTRGDDGDRQRLAAAQADARCG